MLVLKLYLIFMEISVFNIQTTRRLSLSLIIISGTLIFAAFDMIGVGITSNNYDYSKAISGSLPNLMLTGFCGILALVFVSTPVLINFNGCISTA